MKNPLIDRRLYSFAAIVRTGSISAAARELGLVQGAVSAQVKDLEGALGVSLLDRHSRGVTPSAAGLVLMRKISELEQLLAQGVLEVRRAGGVTARPLHVGLPPSIMRLVGADIVLDAATLLPGRPVRLVEDLSVVLANSARRGEIEVGFIYDAPEIAGFERHPICEEELLFVTAAHRAQGDGPIRLSEALEHDIFCAGDGGIATVIRRVAESQGLDARIVADIRSVAAISERLQSGGASLLPYGSAIEGIRKGLLAARPLVDPPVRRTLWLILRGADGRANVPGSSDFLRATIGRIQRAGGAHSRSLFDDDEIFKDISNT